MGDIFNHPLFWIALCGVFLSICVGPILTGLLFYFWYAAEQKEAEKWKTFANKNGFDYTPPNLFLRRHAFMSGKFEGREVVIFSKIISRSLTVTIIRLKVSDTRNFFLSTGEKGMFGNFYQTRGGNPVTVGSGFDEKLSTNSNSPALAAKILQADSNLLAEIKATLPLELLARDNAVSVSIRGSYTEEAKLLRLLRLALRFASVLEQNL